MVNKKIIGEARTFVRELGSYLKENGVEPDYTTTEGTAYIIVKTLLEYIKELSTAEPKAHTNKGVTRGIDKGKKMD